MVLNNDKTDKKFDIIQSEFNAYKRWGFATGYPSPSQEPVEGKESVGEVIDLEKKDQTKK